MRARFYVPGVKDPGEQVSIRGEEHHHLRNVLRLVSGDAVELFDGAGRGFLGEVLEVDNSQARVRVASRVLAETESPLSLSLWVALLKREKLEWVIQVHLLYDNPIEYQRQ